MDINIGMTPAQSQRIADPQRQCMQIREGSVWMHAQRD
jgi:hypothetical protein